ncbi:MAG: hypothetical protein C5B43_01840 [Verrucomicrobia bacterium]|nr:MAG: hypothetical protein C5B43_01840 [Verrucomicrobiota bacterium]
MSNNINHLARNLIQSVQKNKQSEEIQVTQQEGESIARAKMYSQSHEQTQLKTWTIEEIKSSRFNKEQKLELYRNLSDFCLESNNFILLKKIALEAISMNLDEEETLEFSAQLCLACVFLNDLHCLMDAAETGLLISNCEAEIKISLYNILCFSCCKLGLGFSVQMKEAAEEALLLPECSLEKKIEFFEYECIACCNLNDYEGLQKAAENALMLQEYCSKEKIKFLEYACIAYSNLKGYEGSKQTASEALLIKDCSRISQLTFFKYLCEACCELKDYKGLKKALQDSDSLQDCILFYKYLCISCAQEKDYIGLKKAAENALSLSECEEKIMYYKYLCEACFELKDSKALKQAATNAFNLNSCNGYEFLFISYSLRAKIIEENKIHVIIQESEFNTLIGL